MEVQGRLAQPMKLTDCGNYRSLISPKPLTDSPAPWTRGREGGRGRGRAFWKAGASLMGAMSAVISDWLEAPFHSGHLRRALSTQNRFLPCARRQDPWRAGAPLAAWCDMQIEPARSRTGLGTILSMSAEAAAVKTLETCMSVPPPIMHSSFWFLWLFF